jgi:hypothetical protein
MTIPAIRRAAVALGHARGFEPKGSGDPAAARPANGRGCGPRAEAAR